MREESAFERQRGEARHNEGRADAQRREDILLRLNEALAARGHKPAQLPEGYSEDLFAPEDATSSFLQKTPDYNDPRVQALIKAKLGMETDAAGAEAGARAKATFPYERSLRGMKTGNERMTDAERESSARANAKGSLLGQMDAFGETGGKAGPPTELEAGLTAMLVSKGVDQATVAQLMNDIRDPQKREAALTQIMAYKKGSLGSRAPAGDPLSRMTE